MELIVSICLIASCKYKKQAIFLSCFGDFSDYSYFFWGFSGCWGAVLGISAVSATFFWDFPAVGLNLGCCFRNFCGFSYFFWDFSGCWAEFGVLF